MDLALGGWQFNGIYTLQAGLPFDVTLGGPNTNLSANNVRPDLTGKVGVEPGNITTYINGAGFSPAPATLYPDGSFTFDRPGTAGRNMLIGPGLSNLDFAVFKNFHVTERINTQFRAQFYNFTNTPHFGQPNLTLGSWQKNATGTALLFSPNPQFGLINSVLPDSWRQIEIALRITF